MGRDRRRLHAVDPSGWEAGGWTTPVLRFRPHRRGRRRRDAGMVRRVGHDRLRTIALTSAVWLAVGAFLVWYGRGEIR